MVTAPLTDKVPYLDQVKAGTLSPARARSVVADFEYAIREHELLLTKPYEDRAGIIERYTEERAKMVKRLTRQEN